MKNIWILMKINMKRNKLAIIMSVLGAVGLCFFLYAFRYLVLDITFDSIRMGIIDMDKSMLSEDFKSYLTDGLGCELMEEDDYDILSKELIDKDISVIIEIPEGFYEETASGNVPDLTITALDDYENAAFTKAYLNSYLSCIDMLSDSAAGDKAVFTQLLANYNKEDIPISAEAAQIVDLELNNEKDIFIFSFGFYLMIVFGIIAFLAYMILDDRLSGVFARIKISPVKPAQYIIGSGIFGLILCLFEVAIYCGYIIVKDINIGFPVQTLAFMMSLFSLFTVCFTITVSLAIRSKGAVIAIVIGFSTVGAILGGAYFPLDLAPKSLQSVAKVLPQYWFMDTLRKLQADPGVNIYPNIIILILFTVLTFLIGAVLFSQNHKNS